MLYFIQLLKGIIARLCFHADSFADFRYRHPALVRDLGAFVLVLLFALVIWVLSAASGNPSPFGY